MIYAISGSHGFLGENIIERLEEKGDTVARIDQKTLFDPTKLINFFDKKNPDVIIHLAAAGSKRDQIEPSTIVFSNIFGALNMLSSSIHINYRAFINVSTSSVYGKKQEAMSERDLLEPESFYATSKASAEHLSVAFAKEYDKPIVSIRPFSVYGEGEDNNRFIPTIIKHMLDNNIPLPLDKSAVHDWIYIQDFIDAVLLVADNAHKLQGKAINIGTGRQHTNGEICEMLKKISGKPYIPTLLHTMHKEDSLIWMANNERLTQLGWYPRTMLREGLEKTYDWYKEEYGK